jgi:glycosyltransferase involved in cell wall biosynthesis
LEKGHKRLDRLAPLLALLADSSFEWSFDLIGDGAYLPQLKRQFAGDSRVRFLGLLSGDSYWKALSQLDALVFLSDYEGTSRAALEGMCVGVAPVYPDFSPASKELLGPLSPRLLYPTGDMGCAAAKISTLAGLAPQERLALSSELLARTERHRDGTYERGFAEFVRRVLSLPAIGKRSVLSPSLSWMPLGLYTRLFPKHF